MASILNVDTISKQTSAGLILVNSAFQGYCGLTALKTASYAILDTDNYSRIEVDTTSGDITITLPLKSNNLGRIIQIANIKGGTYKVIINPHATDANKLSNDGLSAIWLPKIGNFVTFQESANSGFWEIVNERISSQLRLDGYAGYGGTDTRIMRFTTLSESYGNCFSENHSTGYSSNAKGLEITINRSGRFAFDYQIYDGTDFSGLSLNSAQLTTNITSITTTTRLALTYTLSGGTTTWVGYLKKNDVVRTHANAVGATNALITVSYLG